MLLRISHWTHLSSASPARHRSWTRPAASISGHFNLISRRTFMLNVRLISTAMLSVAVLLVGSVSNLAQSGGPIVFTANLTATQEAPAPADSTPATAGGVAPLLFNPAAH